MSLAKRENKIFEQIQSRLSEYIRITDAEEEVCELYSVYYSREGGSSRSKQNRVDSRKTELDLEIKGGKRTLSLTINQNPNINGELGQTGGVLWNSSMIMSEFFAQRSEWAGNGSLDVGETNIVELGTGCGLVGLVLHQLGARRVALTDQQRMMKVINRNIAAAAVSARQPNRASGGSRRQKPGDFGGGSRGECEIYATEYLWGRPPEDLRITSKPIDMVVVSDCVYHESIAPLLVHTLADLCRSKSNKADDGSTVAVVVGQELRSDLVHQAFVEALLRTFVVYRVPVSADVDGFYALYVAWLKDEEEQ